MEPQLFYFGTNLVDYGHYIWKVTPEGLRERSIDFSKLPFNPEDYPRHPKGSYLPNGTALYYFEHGYSILAIAGSCVDHRPNSKTVFFAQHLYEPDNFLQFISTFYIVEKIIKAVEKKYPESELSKKILYGKTEIKQDQRSDSGQ